MFFYQFLATTLIPVVTWSKIEKNVVTKRSIHDSDTLYYSLLKVVELNCCIRLLTAFCAMSGPILTRVEYTKNLFVSDDSCTFWLIHCLCRSRIDDRQETWDSYILTTFGKLSSDFILFLARLLLPEIQIFHLLAITDLYV